MPIEITTPVGRIVWGHPTKTKGKTRKNPNTGANEAVMKNGVQVQIRSFGLAVPKADFQAHIWPAMSQEVSTVFPNGAPGKFAWKYVDGDSVDGEGKPYSLREGYAGCFVLAYSSELSDPPAIFKLNGNAYQQMPIDAIKCGDYVAVGTNFKVNVPVDRTQTPSIYVNPLGIEFVGYGTEIQSGGTADPMALFGGQQRALPPGASATPIGNPNAPGMPGMGMQPGMAPGQPQPMGQPMVQPGYAPQPMAHPQPMAQPQPMQQPGQPQYAPQPQYQPQPQPMQPQYAPQPQPGQMPPPAHDFVQNAGMAPGQPQPMGQLMVQPGYAPQPMAQPQQQYQPQPMQQPGR